MSDISAELPQEVISEILLRLPVKSIGRSRCVSEPWLSLLTSYDFIKAHFAHHTHFPQQQNLLLRSSSYSLFGLTLHLGGGNHLRKIKLFSKDVVTLVDSCNGLLLVDTAERRDKYLINCLTNEYFKLPDSPLALCPHPSFRKYGFGYDSLNDDYKIVSISQCNNHTMPGANFCACNLVDIYSLKMKSWNRFGSSPYGYDIQCDLFTFSCVFVNGALHWIAWKSSAKESLVIVAFDLSSEKFKEIPAPPASVDNATLVERGRLKVIDGCLGIVVKPRPAQKTEIWLMKTYSLVGSWTKLVVDLKPICFHKDKILFEDCQEGVFNWSCLKDGRVELCFVNYGMHTFSEGITCSESLVSPLFNYHT